MDNIVDDHKCLNFAVENITSACPATFGTFPCVGTCSDPNVMYILGANRMGITERSDSSTPQFWLFAACMVLVFGGMAGVGSITNAMCFALLGNILMFQILERIFNCLCYAISRRQNPPLWSAPNVGFAWLGIVRIDRWARGRCNVGQLCAEKLQRSVLYDVCHFGYGLVRDAVC